MYAIVASPDAEAVTLLNRYPTRGNHAKTGQMAGFHVQPIHIDH
jgi:hypothetical protein